MSIEKERKKKMMFQFCYNTLNKITMDQFKILIDEDFRNSTGGLQEYQRTYNINNILEMIQKRLSYFSNK